jgi:hypothetical protein
MDEYGLVNFGGGLMTLPGLLFFAWVSLIFFTFAYQATRELPQPWRAIKFTIGAVGLSVAVGLFMKAIGWWVFV